MRHAPSLPILLALAAFAPPGAQAASDAPPRAEKAAAPEPPPVVQSAEDRGFVIVLMSPTEPWINGRQAIRIDAIIPRDDTVEQVDFFVDRKLVFVDTDEPYTTSFDFGAEIRRHTIEVKALTKEGRRARLSFVSRSIDPSENADGRVVTLTAMVRDAAGRPVDRLSVSDFTVTEGGARQPIVHFLPGPSPASMAMVVDPAAWMECRGALQRFLGTLPGHQAIALLGPPDLVAPPGDAPAEPDAAAAVASAAPAAAAVAKPAAAVAGGKPKGLPAPASPSAPFTYDVPSLAASLSRSEAEVPPAEPPPAETAAVARRPRKEPPPPSLAGSLGEAATALASRRGPRLLLIVTATAPIGDEPLGPAWPPPAPAEAPKPPRAADSKGEAPEPPADPLAAALEEARRTGAAVHVIALPAPDGLSWHDARTAAGKLQAAVEASGGTYEVASDSEALARAFASVSETLRHQYVVTYVSAAPGQPGWKPLEVKAGSRDTVVEAPRAVYLPE